MASTPEAVKEMLVTKSVDYAGRPKTYGFYNLSRGGLYRQIREWFTEEFKENIEG